MRYLLILLFLCSCASTPKVGTKRWYNLRMAELQTSYANGELTKSEFFALRGQTENTYNATLISPE